jgi:hypothetical protein
VKVLRKENEELRKEIAILKKEGAKWKQLRQFLLTE